MKSIYDKYQDLLDLEEESISHSMFGFNRNNMNDEEIDTLFGSEDIANIQDKLPDVPDKVTPKGPADIQEEVHFHRYTTRRQHKYTEKELERIRESCKATIVHDYSENDMFHQSDEERAANDLLAEIRVKLHGLKSTYSKVDQYILAMRTVVEACEMIEEKANFIHPEDEFYSMISEGKIYITGVPMPRLRKADRYNQDLIIRYISNPELDPSDLVFNNKPNDSFYDDWDEEDDESDDEKMYRLLSEDEVNYIIDNEDKPPMIKVHDIKNKYIKGYDRKSMFKSNRKKESKKDKYMKESLHDLLNKIQANPINNPNRGYSSSWLLTNSMFEPEKKEKDFWDDLYFDGSWTNKNDLFLYDMAVRDKMLDQHPVGERYLTNQDKELQTFFRTMEENGINVVELRRRMNMADEDLRKEEAKKVAKDNKKIESALIQRIEKLNGDPKFKKLVTKAEKAINKQMEEYQ